MISEPICRRDTAIKTCLEIALRLRIVLSDYVSDISKCTWFDNLPFYRTDTASIDIFRVHIDPTVVDSHIDFSDRHYYDLETIISGIDDLFGCISIRSLHTNGGRRIVDDEPNIVGSHIAPNVRHLRNSGIIHYVDAVYI